MTDFQPKEILSEFLSIRGLPAEITELTADASTRHYFRIQIESGPAVACVYPEENSESALSYLDVTELFLSQGLPVARVIDRDLDSRVLILGDLGDRVLRSDLLTASPDSRRKLLSKAISLIPRIQLATAAAYERDSVASRVRFDREKLMWEFDFFLEHYYSTAMKRPLPAAMLAEVRRECEMIAGELEERAEVLCHRDFHAANLMVAADSELKIIDHQDARIGSIAYDLVSLLLDRVDEPPNEDHIAEMRRYFLDQRLSVGLAPVDETEFAAEFRLQAIQRCLKAVGTFSYQSAVRGKTYFIPYIRPMFQIVDDSATRLNRFPALREMVAREVL